MRKRSIILIVIISNIILLNSLIGVSSIEVGVDYTYIVTQSRIYARVGDNKYILNGFRFGGATYPVDTSVSCVITNINQGDIDYNCYIDNQTSIGYSVSNWINRIFDYYMIYTTVKTYELVENWQNTALFNLFFFVMRSYVHPATYNWNFINTLENTLYNTYNHTTNFPGVECEFHMKKTNELISIESWIGGKIEGLYGEQFDADTNLTAIFLSGIISISHI